MKDFLIRGKNLQSGTKATCFLWVNSFIPISLIEIYCWIVKISVTLLLFLKLCMYNPLFPLNAIHIVYTQLLNPLWKWASDTSAGETTTGDCTGHWSRVGITLPPLYNLSSSFPCGEQTRRQRMRPSSSSTSHFSFKGEPPSLWRACHWSITLMGIIWTEAESYSRLDVQ